MRISTVAAVSLGVFSSDVLNSVAEAVRCGTPLTTECWSDSDVRYDADYTKDLKEQDPRWGNFEGYWKVELNVLDGEGTPIPPKQHDPNGAREYPYVFRPLAFYNHTFSGSRFIASRYYFNNRAPQDFCDQPIEPPMLNVLGDGKCGVNGYVEHAGFYAVSTYENDGSMNEFRATGSYSSFGDAAPMDHPEMPSRYSVLDSGTVYNFLQIPGVYVQDSSYVFIDNDTVSLTNSAVSLYGPNVRRKVDLGRQTRLTEEEYVKGIENAYKSVEANILLSERLPIPFNDQFYPTEEEWCGKFKDPDCSVSPYQEPAASLNDGGIALVVVLCLAFVTIVFFVFLKHTKAAQKKRYKEHLIRSIARNITIAPAAGKLSADKLKAEFDLIDKDKGGTICKDELWEFVSSEKTGVMSEKDFNAMWSVIDIDESGEIDFVEFITFLSSCGDQFDKVHEEQKGMTKEQLLKYASQRLSVRNLASSSIEEGDHVEDA